MRTTKLRSKLSLLFIALAALIAIPAAAALADLVTNNVAITDGNKIVEATTGVASPNVGYFIQVQGQGVDGQQGCNASDGSTAKVTINTPPNVTATPNALTFNGCNAANTQNVSFTATQAGDYNITASVTDSGGGSYGTSPASFTLQVRDPAPTDTTKPSTTASLSQEPNAAGWNNENVSVTLNASDNLGGSGLKKVTYSATGAQPISSSTYTTPFPINTEGTTTISYFAEDNAGNVEATKTLTVKLDKTAPTISGSSSPDANANGWNNTDVAVSFECSDTLSGLASCGPNQTVSSEGSDQSVLGTATDQAGNSANDTVTGINIDKTAPTGVTGIATPAANDNGWHKSALAVDFSGTDTTSGIDSCTQDVSYSGPDSATASVNGTCTDKAGNSTPGTFDIKYDATKPTVALNGGPSGSYDSGSTIPAAPSCDAADETSDLASCEVTGYSTGVGNHTLTATATDNAGNTNTATRTYEVKAWTLKGFYSPVDYGTNGAIVWNTVKGGSTVPLKFEAFNTVSGTELTNPSIVSGFSAKLTTCPNGTLSTDAIEILSTGGTALRYDTTGGQFIQNWQTPKRAGACYQVTANMGDGTSIPVAYFQLK